MLIPLLVLSLVATPGPRADSVAVARPTSYVQEPSKPKVAPKQAPKPAPPPKSGGSARTRPNAGAGGSARPQTPRANPGAPRATGEPKLKRRGT